MRLSGDTFPTHFIRRYVFSSNRDRELVHVFAAITTESPKPSAETDGGQFFSGHLDEEVTPYLPDGKAAEPSTESKFIAFFKSIIRKFKTLFELIVVLFT